MEAKKRTRLCLARKRGQSLVVDGPARIVVYEIKPDLVRLAIEADPGVRIDRQELLEREPGRGRERAA